MPGNVDHVLSKFSGARSLPEKNKIANEPFVVVSVVMNLTGEDSVPHGVRMIDPGRGFLLPDRITITMELGVGMSRHMPHVCNPSRRLAVERGRNERTSRFFIVPEMNSVMVCRVHWSDLKNLIEESINCLITGNKQGFFSRRIRPTRIFPDLKNEKCFCFDIVRLILNERFEITDVLAAGVESVVAFVKRGE